jgi:putative ABC transport system substrate-binding protein
MTICLRRREFIAGLGGAAVWPVAGSGQQRTMPVVGWLSGRNSETDANVLPAFRRGLNRQGYVEGRNVTIEYRWADTQFDRLPALGADLVRRQVAVLVVAGAGLSNSYQAVYAITTTTPIVTAAGVSDFAFRRPGGNVTGVNAVFGELGGKRLGLLHDVLPAATTIAVLTLPGSKEGTDVPEARECSVGCRSKS